MAVSIVNQWALTFNQPTSFGTTPPALQSTMVALTPANSVGGGSGTPSSGNWLFCISGWNQNTGLSGVTVAASDDIHSFWRPGNELTSTWAVSTSSGKVRTNVWYTANLARVPGNVYVAPSGHVAGLAILIIEVSGLGPWDTVTGIFTNYAAAATSLNLTLGAPSAQALLFGAVTGDSTAAGQAFAPASWTALHTTSATNGVDHTCDAVLTSAYLVTSGSVSVNGTATSATDLSGVIIGVLTSAPSPIPGTQNPNWPFMKFEAAFGGGFQTPQDQLTWTDLTSRLWSWDETTGVQYQLGQIQATELQLELDNFDNALGSDNPGSQYYSNALNQNMSFQSGTSPWAGNNNAVISQSTAHVFTSSPGATATFSLQVLPDGVTSLPGAVSEKDTVTANSVYTASAWFFSVAGYNGAQAVLSWYTSGGSFISSSASSVTNVPATTWTQASVTATAPGTAAFASLTVQFSATPAATAFWVAEAAVVAGSSVVNTGLVTTGVPIRIRAAIGTLGGLAANRWYVIQRNMEQWPQMINTDFRRYIAGVATDVWSALSAANPTPYRGEIAQDNPYAWWAMDDQPLQGGVQPTSLRNSAPNNTNVLNIIAAPGGVSGVDAYSSTGVDLTATGTNNVTPPLPSVAVYAVAQQQGWMYGDPQSAPASFATTTANPVTANPGSAAWQQSGLQGNTGTQGWFLTCNDANFPPLSGGVTVLGWFNAAFFGSATGYTITTNKYQVVTQPYSVITLCTLGTATAPVCELQLDLSGHLNFITFNGTTPTSNVIYSSSDLRNGSFNSVHITLTTTTWSVLVNGGLTASVSGTATGMTSAWTWLTLNGDYGNTSGGGTPANLTHSGNVAYSHWTVFPSILPSWQMLGHYCAAITGFGLLPAPQTLSLSRVANRFTGISYTPDGSEFQGSYGIPAPNTTGAYTLSAVAVAQAGSITSGPSARAAIAGYGTDNGGVFYGDAVWVGLTSLSPSVGIYTASSANAETNAATVCGTGDSFVSGYGSGASGGGVCQTAAGSGSSPPGTASALGDTVQQRIERILGYGGTVYPGRSIDAASLAVQAATDTGGQQIGPNVTNISQSDSGMLFINNLGNLTYWQRSHLASQYATPVWQIGPNQVPYYREISWIADPQRIWNAITIQPFAPDGTSLPLITPANATAVAASQQQFGPQPRQITSYLQSTTEMQNQANWLSSNYGTLHARVDGVKIDAAPNPQGWTLVLGVNVSDITSIQNWQIGGGITGTFRVSRIKRHLEFGGRSGQVEGSVSLTCDFEPTSYWS